MDILIKVLFCAVILTAALAYLSKEFKSMFEPKVLSMIKLGSIAGIVIIGVILFLT